MTGNNTNQVFGKQKEDRRKPLTHEQIAADLATFARAGGTIEVLGNTSTLRTIPPPASRSVSVSDSAPLPKKGGKAPGAD